MKVAVHITHESARKMGGIGAVLSGICTLQAYKDYYDKTVFYGPLFELPTDTFSHFGGLKEILYSSHNQYDAGGYGNILGEIVKKYNLDIVYGRCELVSEFDISKHNVVDVINIGINKMGRGDVDKFKYELWKKFGINSQLYDKDWDYEQYVRIAIPYQEILAKLYGSNVDYFHFSHEYMGVPSALSVILSGKKEPTIFIAHEVATARSIVEHHQGHDISFYNILRKSGKTLEQVFGSQEFNSRNELIKRAVHFDSIFAVGNHVKEEYYFLVPDTPPGKIKIVYNGVSARSVNFSHKQESRVAHREIY